MNIRRINLALWTLTAALAAGALVCAAVGVLSPVEVRSNAAPNPRKAPATSQASPDAQLSAAAFESIWALNLRKPLTDVAPDATAAQPDANANTVTSGGPFVLVGTIGQSIAIIRTGTGAIEVKAVGELINGAKIVAVRPLQVDIEVGGARTTIAKPRDGSGG
jgi:hypothetical protein